MGAAFRIRQAYALAFFDDPGVLGEFLHLHEIEKERWDDVLGTHPDVLLSRSFQLWLLGHIVHRDRAK